MSNMSPETSAQVLHYVGEYRRRVPQGIFKENDGFSTLRMALQGKRNCRVAVKILFINAKACSRLGDERLKAFYITILRRESYNDFLHEARRAQTQPLKTVVMTIEQDVGDRF